MLARFQKAFANPAREAEDEIAPSLKAALFLLNDEQVLACLQSQPGNLMERLLKHDDSAAAEELYLSILSRPPSAGEKTEVVAYLGKKAGDRQKALFQLAWALLASTSGT